MQDRYVGDIGDFGKYGLLRTLTSGISGTRLSLGVVWYLVPDHGPTGDGRYTTYFDRRERFRDCDEDLFDSLEPIAKGDRRNVRTIREESILPSAKFYEALLDYGCWNMSERIRHRQGWLAEAIKAVSDADIVFVDPDNGLEIGTPRHRLPGRKYVYFDELAPYVNHDQSLVVYQHMPREPSTQYIQRRVRELMTELSFVGPIWALRWHPYSPRAYFVLAAPRHADVLGIRIDRLLAGPWGEHFELIEKR